MKERHIGQVSFNLLDEYEKGLWVFANQDKHGKFSQYIKRLIEQDRNGHRNIILPMDPVQDLNEDKSAAQAFL